MCAVVDPPLFIAITNSADARHVEFGALKNWLTTGIGKAVMGGTKYRAELMKVRSVLGFITELEKRGKIVTVNSDDADKSAAYAVAAAKSNNFDDEHLVGLVARSGCKVICLDDPRAHPFLKNSKLYFPTAKTPKLYTGERNRVLLSKQYQAPCCNKA